MDMKWIVIGVILIIALVFLWAGRKIAKENREIKELGKLREKIETKILLENGKKKK